MFPAPRQDRLDALALDGTIMRAIDQPTLVIHGANDQVIPIEASLNLMSCLPNAQLHIFGQCGHWVQIERGTAFCGLVMRFLEGALDSPRATRERRADALR
jgi:2-hydroxymuconate-semialdehyde hydrolase